MRCVWLLRWAGFLFTWEKRSWGVAGCSGQSWVWGVWCLCQVSGRDPGPLWFAQISGCQAPALGCGTSWWTHEMVANVTVSWERIPAKNGVWGHMGRFPSWGCQCIPASAFGWLGVSCWVLVTPKSSSLLPGHGEPHQAIAHLYPIFPSLSTAPPSSWGA